MSTGSLVPFGTNIQSVKRYGESLFCPRGVCRVTLPARDLMWWCLIPASPWAVWEQTEVWGSSSRCSLPLVSPDCSTRAELGSFTALPSAAIAVAKRWLMLWLMCQPIHACGNLTQFIHVCQYIVNFNSYSLLLVLFFGFHNLVCFLCNCHYFFTTRKPTIWHFKISLAIHF